MSQIKKPKFLSDQETSLPATAEQDLWLSALILGIYSALRKDDQKELEWLESDRYYIGSYRWICDNCFICPDTLRTKLLIHRLSLRPETEQPQRIIQGFYRFNTRPKKPALFRRRGIYKRKTPPQ